MKVCIFSESSADEAGIQVLVEAILGEKVDVVANPRLRSRGWRPVFSLLPTVLKHMHYHSDAEAAVVVVDSDLTPVHDPSHDEPGGHNDECRLCCLRRVVEHTRAQLRPINHRPALRIAVGMTVPAIEAWYLCGRDPHVTEAAWIVGLNNKRKYPYTKIKLKEDVYGTSRPSLELETECATREATRVARRLDLLETAFPNGFGSLARDVRNWHSPAGLSGG
jgi:hypothetical protein